MLANRYFVGADLLEDLEEDADVWMISPNAVPAYFIFDIWLGL